MIDRRLSLRHLRTFVEVARGSSVVRAASKLNVSQPAVTKTIRELESLLGVALFERHGRGLRITGAGEVFLRHAHVAMTTIRQGFDHAAGQGAKAADRIRIGVLPTASARLMPPAISLFLTKKTDVEIKIISGENAMMLEQLRNNSLDLVVGRLAEPEKMIGFFFEHLYSERIVFAVRRGHPLLSAVGDLMARMGDYPVLMPTRTSVIRPFVERYFIANGTPDPPIQIETVSEGFGRAFVADTDAVWIISEGVVAKDVADGRLAILDLDTAETLGAVGLTMRTGTTMSPSFEVLLGCIRAAAERSTFSSTGPISN